MSEQPTSCSLFVRKWGHPIVKLKNCKEMQSFLAKVMVNNDVKVRRLYIATFINVSAIKGVWKPC